MFYLYCGTDQSRGRQVLPMPCRFLSIGPSQAKRRTHVVRNRRRHAMLLPGPGERSETMASVSGACAPCEAGESTEARAWRGRRQTHARVPGVRTPAARPHVAPRRTQVSCARAKAGNSWVEVDSVIARRGGSACMPRISGVSKCGSSKLDGDDASCSHGWWRPTPRGPRARANPPRRIRRWRAETLPEEPGRRASPTTSCRTRRAGSW